MRGDSRHTTSSPARPDIIRPAGRRTMAFVAGYGRRGRTYFEYNHALNAYTGGICRRGRAGGGALREDPPAASRVALHSPGRIVLCPGAGPDHRSRPGRHIRRLGEAGGSRYPPTRRSRQPGLLPGRRDMPDLPGAQERLSEDCGTRGRATASARTPWIANPRRADPRICRHRSPSSVQRRGPRRDRRCLLRRHRLRAGSRSSPPRARNQPRRLFRRRVPVKTALAASLRDGGAAGASSLHRGRFR